MSDTKTNSLRTITPDQLAKILEDHLLWRETNGVQGNCADLHYANLAGADLYGANLAGANLHYANLRSANLQDANLEDANLSYANLRDANLRDAYLQDADLSGANLNAADLSGAKLQDANLSGAKNVPDFQRCPKDGAFKAFKKVCIGSVKYILELEVPADAQRVSSTGIKCRCSQAKVLRAMNLDGTPVENQENLVFQSMCARTNCFDFPYRIGESVEVLDFNADIRIECAAGIHFFMEMQEAVDYQY